MSFIQDTHVVILKGLCLTWYDCEVCNMLIQESKVTMTQILMINTNKLSLFEVGSISKPDA